MGRDYKKEYQEYHSKPEQKKNRAKRNKANRNSNCGPGQEVDHKVPLIRGGSNSPSNWRVVSEETNRKKGSKKMSNIQKLGLAVINNNQVTKLSASSKKTAASVKKSWWWSEDAPKAEAVEAEAVEAAAEDAAVKEQLRVAILSGSTGENSKSRALAEAYRKSLEARGAAVDWLDMREMGDLPDVITGDHDKINPYLDRFAGADAYVVASPIYNWGPSGKVKQFMDLAMDSDTMTGKPYSLLSGAGSPRSALAMGGLANQLDMELKGIGIGAGVQVAGKEYNKLTGNVNSAVTARAKANADTLYDVASSLRKTADYPFDTSQLEAFIANTKRD
jgi:NAD(P)H-dependent FMN reductase